MKTSDLVTCQHQILPLLPRLLKNQVSGRFYHTLFLEKGKPSSILPRHKHPHAQPSWAFWLISTDFTQLAFNFSNQENVSVLGNNNVPKEQTIRP